MSEQQPAIAISRAALHAALVELHARGRDREADSDAVGFLIDGLNVLITLLDPRHEIAAGGGASTTPLQDLGPEMLHDEAARAGAAQEEATMPGTTVPAANRPPPANAGTPAPPTINLPGDPGSACAAGAATSSAEGAPNEPAPSAPPPAQAAEERPTPASAPPRPFGGAPITRWSEERLALLRERFPTCTDDAALLAELNALPGEPISSVKAIGARAHLLKVNRDPEIIRALRAKGAAEAQVKQQAHRSSLHERKWTPERLALLRQEFPPCLDRTALLARINALPGYPIAGVESMRAKAVTLGLRATPDTERQLRSRSGKKGGRKPRAPAPERSAAAAPPMPPSLPPTPPPAPAPIVAAPELPPEREAEIADAALAQRHQRARDMLAKSLSEKGRRDEFALASIVAAHTKLPLREVMRLMGEVRRSLEEAKTARQPSAPTTVAMLHSSPPRRAIARSDDE